MTEQPFNMIALIATLLTCIVVDGGLLVFCVWIAEGFGKGIFYFFVGGGPPTILVFQPLYYWFKKRISVHAKL